MKKILFSFVLIALLGMAPKPAKAQLIQIDGSSTVFPITEAVSEEFQKSKKGAVKVTVGIAGTGGGFKKFCRGETDISDASRPILKAEMETCKQSGVQFIELPIAYDALTVIINPKNDWVKTLTIPDLKKMWEPSAQGKVTTWNQVRSEWPNNPLKLFGPGADSGTFDYFTEAIVGKASKIRSVAAECLHDRYGSREERQTRHGVRRRSRSRHQDRGTTQTRGQVLTCLPVGLQGILSVSPVVSTIANEGNASENS